MLPRKRSPIHRGEMLLKEFLEPREITQKKFANHLGWTNARLNEIINGRRELSADSALSLGDVFDMEPEFWLNLQINFDLWHAKQTHKKKRVIDEAA